MDSTALKLLADYNVTCPDFRVCEVRHKFSSPCLLWDCNACWWNYPNCTSTEEAPSENCPYATCHNVPRPSHSNIVTTIISVVATLVFVSLFFKFFYRRFRRMLQGQLAGEPEDQFEVEDETEDEEEVEDEAQAGLLQRARHFFMAMPTRMADSFRSVIFGHRANPAPPELVEAELGDLRQRQPPQNPDLLPAPSAPPVPLAQDDNREDRPIIRERRGGGLENQNYGAMAMRERTPSPNRLVPLMEEVPLANPEAEALG